MAKVVQARKQPRKKVSEVPFFVKPSFSHPSQLRDFLSIVFIALFAYLFLAFFTAWGGVAGRELRISLIDWFGTASYFVILLPLMTSVFLFDPRRKPTWLHLTYLGVWFFSVVLFFDLFNRGGKSVILTAPFLKFFGKGGTIVFSWTLLIAATLFVTNISLESIFNKLKIALMALVQWMNQKPRLAAAGVVQIEEDLHASPLLVEPAMTLPLPSPAEASVEEKPLPEDLVIKDVPAGLEPKKPEHHPVFVASKSKQRMSEDLKGYRLPSPSLLEAADPKREKGARIEPSDYSRLLEETLRNFGVEAQVIHVERGPTVTRYELQPAKGVKVSKIVSLTDDIALALAATSLRIEAPIPGKSAIGIEVPNSSVAMVYFKDLLAAKVYRESPQKMILALGKDITGQPIFTDLKRMPHLLIAGATGSGKTVCINTLIASILYKATPLEVQFVMIDPKRVELTIYDGIPHLIQEVVTDPKQAAKVLFDVLAIMDDRYNMFKEARVRNLEEYNRARPDTPLPHIVVLIDELADLMMLAAATVETSISRLTALARAAGIHLIVATQRPSVDVITGIIKANIPSRIAFAVSSMVDSRTILDTGGAEKLLGRGDMLFAPIDAMKPIRLQGAYVGLPEIEALVAFWSEQPPPQNLVQFPQMTEEVISEDAAIGEDELYSEAKDVILRTGQASVSTLQRKMKVGYARAGRLMDLLEKHGIVGGADGAKPRKILIPNPYKQG